MLVLNLVAFFLLLTSSSSESFEISTTTANSASVTYANSEFPANFNPTLSKNLAQVALSPLLIASTSFNNLPLQSLFPQIKIKPEENMTENHFNLTSILLNHSLHHGSDSELDRIVFSHLPQGTKLVLKTVKIMKADEDGKEEEVGNTATTLNILPIGSEVNEEEGEIDNNDKEDKDLESDASSVKGAGYGSYGSNEKVKDKQENYHRGQDFGQSQQETLTDLDGKKVNKYQGREKGLTDFDHVHENFESNERERFKKSKKINKGRKVTGFKRVYHKEEYQRTEHFYDDEEAKKIADSFGLTEAKEKKEHKEEDEDRKYHGGRLENTEGKKVKTEHSTYHGHDKAQNINHGQSETAKYFQHHQSNSDHVPENYQSRANHQYSNYNNPNPLTPSAPQPTSLNLKPTKTDQLEGQSRSKPDEVKIYRAQTNRFFPTPQYSYYYAPNFGPTPSTTTDHAQIVNYYHQGYYSGSDNVTRHLPVTTPRMTLNEEDRYAGQFHTRRPILQNGSTRNRVTVSTISSTPSPIPFYHNGKNLISIDKAIVTRLPNLHLGPFSVPNPRGVFFPQGFQEWTPIPSESGITAHSQPTKQRKTNSLFPEIRNAPKNNSNEPSFPTRAEFQGTTLSPPRRPTPRVQSGRLHIARIQTTRPLSSTPLPPSIPNLPLNPNFYYGPTLIRNQNGDNSHQNSPNYVPAYYSQRHPTFPNFMNNLMNSVSQFFNRMGR